MGGRSPIRCSLAITCRLQRSRDFCSRPCGAIATLSCAPLDLAAVSQTTSKIRSGAPVASLDGSPVQMVQSTCAAHVQQRANPGCLPVSSINGQQYPPGSNGPQYWLPTSTAAGQQVLRPTNQVSQAAHQPPPVPPPPMQAAASQVWQQLVSPSGQPYYHNLQTHETAWQPPDGAVVQPAKIQVTPVPGVSVIQPAPVQQKVKVKIPKGAYPGYKVSGKHEGIPFSFKVPQGVKPGDSIKINLPVMQQQLSQDIHHVQGQGVPSRQQRAARLSKSRNRRSHGSFFGMRIGGG